LTDFSFSEFKDTNLLVSSSVEDTIKIWKLEDHPKEPLMKGTMELQHQVSASVNRVGFHPKVKEIVLSCQTNGNINLFDVNEGKEKIIMNQSKNMVDSFSWSYLGDELCTSHSDKKFRLWDIRNGSNPLVKECMPHTSSKSFSVEFISSDLLFTVGFDKMDGGREYTIWDKRNLDQCVSKTKIDQGSSFYTTFFDWDQHILYLSGKGDREIKFYEVIDKHPYIEYLTEYKSNSPNAAICKFPKSSVNVMKHEISRFMKLTNESSIEPISFHLLRNETIDKYFQEDVFPDTWDETSSITSNEFFEGKEIKIQKVSLKPKDEVSIFDVDEEKGGKKRIVATSDTSTLEEKKEEKSSSNDLVKKVSIIAIPSLSFLFYYWNYRFIIIPIYLYLIYLFFFKKKSVETNTTSTEVSSSTTGSSSSPSNLQEEGGEEVPVKKEISTTKIISMTPEEIEKDERSSINLIKRLDKITKEDLLAKDYGDETLKAKEVDLVSIIKGKEKMLIQVKGRTDYRVKSVPISKSSFYNDIR
jgi:hypothetical protein